MDRDVLRRSRCCRASQMNMIPFCACHKCQTCIYILKFREPNWSDFLNISIRNSLFSNWSSKCCDQSLLSLINWILYYEPPSDTLSPYTRLKFGMRHASNSWRMQQYRVPLGFLLDKFDLSFIWKTLTESLASTGKDLEENSMFLTWWREWITGFRKCGLS